MKSSIFEFVFDYVNIYSLSSSSYCNTLLIFKLFEIEIKIN